MPFKNADVTFYLLRFPFLYFQAALSVPVLTNGPLTVRFCAEEADLAAEAVDAVLKRVNDLAGRMGGGVQVAAVNK